MNDARRRNVRLQHRANCVEIFEFFRRRYNFRSFRFRFLFDGCFRFRNLSGWRRDVVFLRLHRRRKSTRDQLVDNLRERLFHQRTKLLDDFLRNPRRLDAPPDIRHKVVRRRLHFAFEKRLDRAGEFEFSRRRENLVEIEIALVEFL